MSEAVQVALIITIPQTAVSILISWMAYSKARRAERVVAEKLLRDSAHAEGVNEERAKNK